MIDRDELGNMLIDYRLQGYCCSQIITEVGLKALEKENEDMVDASAALCFGLNQGKDCGALTAAMQILFLADPEEATQRTAQELFDWFEATYDSVECEDILEGDPLNKTEKCPFLVEATLNEMLDLLEID